MLPVLVLISVRRQVVTELVRTASAASRRMIRVGMDDAMLLELQEEAVLFVEDDGFEGFKAVKCAKQPLDVQILRQLFLAFLEVCLLSVFYCVL